MKKIGVMGGTFNPIHNGHIKLAKAAKRIFKLSKVIFVPTGIPPHKDTTYLAGKEQRFKMVKMAIKGIKNIEISRIEMNRPGYSYAIDTFNLLRKKYGKKIDLYYIMGLDSINEILSWKKPIELLKICKFIVATRPKAKMRTFKRVMKFPPIKQYVSHVQLIELHMGISSSEIREKIKKGRIPKKYLPKAVAKYIENNGLYGK
ncbi:nicotinate-nucleotide adenylyltransferase [Candidatus Margulisiibacteriota bacterium]